MGRALGRLWPWLMVVAFAAGCVGGGTSGGGDDDDGGPPIDVGAEDSGTEDSGAEDSGTEDSGAEDMRAPPPDTGEPEPDMGEPEPEPDMGEPEPDMGEPEPDMGCVPTAEVCNGLDDDCDGVVDNGFAGLGEPCNAGVGACAAEGTTVCDADGGGTVCDAVAGRSVDEVCNGIDDDCDGSTDEALGGMPCETGQPGVCAAGTSACVDGQPSCAPMVAAGAEICDGLDNDCDGQVDDVPGAGGACAAGVGVCARPGTVVCTPEGLACDAVPGQPAPEACNGLDDDCDGEVDDVDGLGDPCSAGIGACAVAGRRVCGDGGLTCDAVPGQPAPEVCNGVDDDCNGAVDDPPVCDPPPVEDCAAAGDEDGNGLADCDDPACVDFAGCQLAPEDCAVAGDEDGNGLADCDDPACAAAPQCRPPVGGVVLLCGNSARDISVIFQPEDQVVFQAGCVPDAGTVGIALSRSGQIDPAVVVPWLQNGGQLMTEYSATAAAFDAVFGGAVPPPGQTGGCEDNVNPVVRFNEDDPFWQGNGALPLSTPEDSGCGFDVSAYPGIVPLGGWDANTVSLAYRDIGAGRFWLVEGDWQDNQQGPSAFSPATQALMRHMLLGGPPPAPRGTLMACGDPTRDVNTFVPPGSGLEVVAGCAPGDEVQAMVIGRNGAGQIVGDQLRAYLEAGGVAITEYNISDEVYNAVFPGANVVQGANNGNCSDQVNPPVRFNEADPFWQANGGLPLGDPNSTGCGFDVGAFPGITPLGGWDAGSVSLAYIDVGAGRLWLVDIDWQDPDAGFGAPSLQLMQYMILDEGGVAPPAEDCDAAGDEDGNGLADCDDPACADTPACAPDPGGAVGSFAVNDGPQWSDPGVQSVSCVQTCAQIFGGAAAEYGCSTVEGAYNGRAWLDGWGDGNSYCSDGNDGPEDFVMPAGGGAYDCGAEGCSYSAYVNDHGCGRVNYCWRVGARLDPNQAFGHHGSCDSFNNCQTAERCADLACYNAGFGDAIDWLEGLCTTLSNGAVPGIVCNLFRNDDPLLNYDAGWGPSGGCDIPVVYDVSCLPAP